MILDRWITSDDIAVMIREAHGKGFDMAGIYKATDETRGANELKAAAEAAKATPKKHRTIVVSYRKPDQDVKVAQGIQWPDGILHVEEGHGAVSGSERSLDSLRSTMERHNIKYHIVYTDEP